MNCYDNAMINAQQMAFLRYTRSPPRKQFIDKPAEIAVFFANVVTTPSADDWVARNGEQSIFSAFRSVLPEVITYQLRYRKVWSLKHFCVELTQGYSHAGLSTWIKTTPGKGDNRSIGA
jgi:hypothetical protein